MNFACCSVCDKVLPRSHFKLAKDGRLVTTAGCLPCRAERHRTRVFGSPKRIEKACTICGIVKPRSEFYPKKTRDYRLNKTRMTIRAECRSCAPALESRNNRSRKYGLTLGEVDAMLAKPCEICGCAERGKHGIAIDHDHKTGKVRGTLCGSCNKGVGFFRDDPSLLNAAISYLMTREG